MASAVAAAKPADRADAADSPAGAATLRTAAAAGPVAPASAGEAAAAGGVAVARPTAAVAPAPEPPAGSAGAQEAAAAAEAAAQAAAGGEAAVAAGVTSAAPSVGKAVAAPLAGFPTWQVHSAAVATPCCPHYSRYCHLRAPCCNALVACRRCHDALVPDGHPMDRRLVKTVKCLACENEDQPLAEVCAFCSTRFASYFCAECAMYDDTPGRDKFHCAGCGVCRLGKRADYAHCDACRVCLPVAALSQHACAARALGRPCSLCQLDMHESVRRCTIPPCGHAMHQGCFETHVKTSFACATCGKSLAAMKQYWAVLDKLMEKDLAGKVEEVSIRCRDCDKVSRAKKHAEFHKCAENNCGSYNTTTELCLPRGVEG